MIEEWTACCQKSPSDDQIKQLSKLTRKLLELEFKSCLTRRMNSDDSCYNILSQVRQRSGGGLTPFFYYLKKCIYFP